MKFHWTLQDNPIRLECQWHGLLATVEPIFARSAAAYVNRTWCVYRDGVLLGSDGVLRSKQAQLAAEAFMREQ